MRVQCADSDSREIPLPGYPKPTRGKPGSGLPPYRTILDACGNIPDDAPAHLNMAHWNNPPKPASNPRKLAKCIMTKLDMDHWDGLRKITPCEMAQLQGFLMDYLWAGNYKEICRQIGNAVPPIVWQHFVRAILKTLQDWRHGRIDDEGHPITQNSSNPIIIN